MTNYKLYTIIISNIKESFPPFSESFPTGGKMKINSKKVLKTCALSLSLLLIGGAAFGPPTKTYAKNKVNNQAKRIGL